MNRKLIDLWVGFFVIFGIAAIIFLALRVGNLASANFSETYVLTANFDNIGGLKVRGPVKSAGVVVGRVTAIGFDAKNYQALVTLSIDGRYRFPGGTSASILTAGLLGEQYVGFSTGYDFEKMLQNNDKLTKNQSAVVLETLISQFMFNKASEDPGKQ